MRTFIMQLIADPRCRRLAFRAAFLLYLAVLVLGSIPGARAEVGEWASGLALHTLTYAALAFLLFYGADGGASHKALKAFLIVAAMGAFDECVQSLFPYRGASVADWLVDVFAALVTVTVLCVVWPKGNAPHRPSAPGNS